MNPDRMCLGCAATLPDAFLDLGSMPFANALVRPEGADRPEARYPLAVAFCPGCRLVQLTDPVPPEDLFSEYLYFSSYSDSFLAHARETARTLTGRFRLGAASRVLEIGSNDGYLLQYFMERGIPVLGVEPARNIAAAAQRRGVPTLNRFFGPESVDEILRRFGPADAIVGNNVLAHVPSINAFLRAVRDCLKPGGVAVFEFPHLTELLARTEFDTIYHEHVFYYSLSAVAELAARAGLALFDVTRHAVHGGSLRVYLQPAPGRPATPAVRAILTEEEDGGLLGPERYRAFSRAVANLKEELRALLWRLKMSGTRLAAYGAPAKGNTLLNACGIGRDLLDFTVDRSPHKQGLLLPGSRLPIRPPDELLRERPDYTLILPWNIADEIVAQQQEYVRQGGRFLVPVPHPRELVA